MTGERNEREDRRADRDKDWPQSFDSGVANGLLERFALLVHFFDEIEKHNHVADNYADQARDSEKRHESERRPHNRVADQRPHDAVGPSPTDHGLFPSQSSAGVYVTDTDRKRSTLMKT